MVSNYSLEIPPVILKRGRSRLIVSIPHAGTYLPTWFSHQLTSEGLKIADTDWHLARLYDFLDEYDATVIIATHSKYLLDLSRSPDFNIDHNRSFSKSLCPRHTFNKMPIYLEGLEPNEAEIERRIDHYWKPYHSALMIEIERLKELHREIRLWDAHSKRGIFPGSGLEDFSNFNIGTDGGRSCDHILAHEILNIADQHPYNATLNGQLRGGYITQCYGRPESGVQALQMSLSFSTYLDLEHPNNYIESKAESAKCILRKMIDKFVNWEPWLHLSENLN